MSARKSPETTFHGAAACQSNQLCLTLPAHAVKVRKNGIEFRSFEPLETWTEMNLQLEVPGGEGKLECIGVIVACNGNRHAGYLISMLFTNLSTAAQAQLSLMA
ncbi:MAG: hypothetical protein JWO95_359 [Verrucomicrobiales bacterium]|nr:hypothetical protein [Verrucomicrobiales bacterium]